MRIALDAMGGDRAPESTVDGALAALRESPDLELALTGPAEHLRGMLAARGAERHPRLEVVAAEEVIEADEPPALAFRRKRDSSMVVAVRLVEQARAGAVVSAGNTGALMAASLLTLGRIPGVERPAITIILPTVSGQGFLFLDAGAHMDPSAANLFQYAVMGSLYAELARGIARPRVGLLNVGTEQGKGDEVRREAFVLLQASELNFAGNVEGREMFAGQHDVVITDGFVGNIVIKSLEGFGGGIAQVLGHELRHSGLRVLLGAALAQHALRRLRKRIDYAEYGGAPLLGVNGVCIKCHGSSDGRAIKNGVRMAAEVLRQDVVGAIARSVSAGVEKRA